MGQSPSTLSDRLGSAVDTVNARVIIGYGSSVDHEDTGHNSEQGNSSATTDPSSDAVDQYGNSVDIERSSSNAGLKTHCAGIPGIHHTIAREQTEEGVYRRRLLDVHTHIDYIKITLCKADFVNAKSEDDRIKQMSMELVPYDKNFAELQKDLHWGMCTACEAEGYDKKKCTGCKMAKYCNRQCQKKDFEHHKAICKRISRFDTARSKLNPKLREVLFGPLQFSHISYHLGSIPDRLRYQMTGPRICVLVEIMEVLDEINPFICDVKVRDVANYSTTVLFNLLTMNPLAFLSGPLVASMAARLFRSLLLKPGNFILLINTHWNFVGPKSGTILVEHPQQVEIVSLA